MKELCSPFLSSPFPRWRLRYFFPEWQVSPDVPFPFSWSDALMIYQGLPSFLRIGVVWALPSSVLIVDLLLRSIYFNNLSCFSSPSFFFYLLAENHQHLLPPSRALRQTASRGQRPIPFLFPFPLPAFSNGPPRSRSQFFSHLKVQRQGSEGRLPFFPLFFSTYNEERILSEKHNFLPFFPTPFSLEASPSFFSFPRGKCVNRGAVDIDFFFSFLSPIRGHSLVSFSCP